MSKKLTQTKSGSLIIDFLNACKDKSEASLNFTLGVNLFSIPVDNLNEKTNNQLVKTIEAKKSMLEKKYPNLFIDDSITIGSFLSTTMEILTGSPLTKDKHGNYTIS